ncbi:MAG: hypothetical protein HY644_04870 [Acidobacteria bacterium]|nr:hypothetical protein [Acidobacteriota bacterium]
MLIEKGVVRFPGIDHGECREDAGDDVYFEHGRAIVPVREPRMYQLVRNKEFGSHLLSLSISDRGLRVYVFTFVSDVA